MARLTAWLGRRHPTQLIVGAFGIGILVGAGLLMLPFATESGESASFLTAIFTSTSSICVTGLIVVDTPTYWSTFGEVVIMLLIQVGGFGIMTLASLLVFLLAGRLGLRGRLLAQAEVAAPLLADVRRLVFAVVKLSLIFEALERRSSRCAGGRSTTTRSAGPSTWGSSTPSRHSTMPASRSGPTT